MRYLYMTLIAFFTVLVLTFKLQNLEVVTLNFLSFSVSLRTSYLFFITYILGMVSGGFVFSLLRSWFSKAQTVPQNKT